jgi:hypothetical protein
MNLNQFLKLAHKLDIQGKYKTSDKIFKIVKAEIDNLDEDPLGISNIQPSGMKDDPVVKKLRQMVMNGEISEQQFWIMLEKHKPGTFENMLNNVGKAGDYDIDKIERNIASQGVRVNPKERDIFAKFYELSNDVYVEFIDSLQSNFASVLRTMARKDELPEMFLEIQDHRAGNLIMELIEPSSKEEFLTREYLELKAKGIGLSDAVEISTGGDYSDIDEYLKAFVESEVPTITAKASRITGLQYPEDEVARKLSDVTVNTLNDTIDNSLTELYYILLRDK